MPDLSWVDNILPKNDQVTSIQNSLKSIFDSLKNIDLGKFLKNIVFLWKNLNVLKTEVLVPISTVKQFILYVIESSKPNEKMEKLRVWIEDHINEAYKAAEITDSEFQCEF